MINNQKGAAPSWLFIIPYLASPNRKIVLLKTGSQIALPDNWCEQDRARLNFRSKNTMITQLLHLLQRPCERDDSWMNENRVKITFSRKLHDTNTLGNKYSFGKNLYKTATIYIYEATYVMYSVKYKLSLFTDKVHHSFGVRFRPGIFPEVFRVATESFVVAK